MRPNSRFLKTRFLNFLKPCRRAAPRLHHTHHTPGTHGVNCHKRRFSTDGGSRWENRATKRGQQHHRYRQSKAASVPATHSTIRAESVKNGGLTPLAPKCLRWLENSKTFGLENGNSAEVENLAESLTGPFLSEEPSGIRPAPLSLTACQRTWCPCIVGSTEFTYYPWLRNRKEVYKYAAELDPQLLGLFASWLAGW